MNENYNIPALKGWRFDVFGNDVCFGEPTVVGVTNSNPDQPLISYTWNINDLDTNIFIDFPDTSSWYVLEAINLDACILRDSIFINVFNYPVIDSIWVSETAVFKGQDLEIEVFTNDNISWEDFDDSNRNQKFFAEESQCYVFEVFNEFNCTKKDSVCIDVKDVFCDNKKIKIPNAFSPNKDNINDTYLIKDEDKIVTKFKLEIFNRLGQKVFSSADIFNTWDGTFRGEELNPQVFDFYLELECIGEKKMFYKGNITLIR